MQTESWHKTCSEIVINTNSEITTTVHCDRGPGANDAVLSKADYIDVAQQSHSLTNWDMGYVQMQPGQFKGSCHQLCLPDVQLAVETNNLVLNEYGTSWPGSYMFGIPLHMLGEASFNGISWGADGTTVCRGEKEHEVVVPPMSSMLLTVDREMLEDYMRTVEGVDMKYWLNHGLVVNDHAFTKGAGQHLMEVLQICFNDPALVNRPSTRNAIVQDLMECVAPLVAGHLHPPRPSLSAFGRSQVVHRAREFIMDHIDEPLQIRDVCKALNVSRRTLQYGFEHVLGVNPVAYLRMLRLNGAREDLVSASADKPTQIKHVVAKWGFWHLSRFSAEYRDLFGELPSKTLSHALIH